MNVMDRRTVVGMLVSDRFNNRMTEFGPEDFNEKYMSPDDCFNTNMEERSTGCSMASIVSSISDSCSDFEVRMELSIPVSKKMEQMVREASIALVSGLSPSLASDGTGGTYMIPHPRRRQTIACFKPQDEEMCAPNNPRGFQGETNSCFRPGMHSTQCATREVFAFYADTGFSGVPETTLVHARHPSFFNPQTLIWKTGSFQEFVDTKETAGNYHYREYSTEDIHRIGCLDIRLVNMDRNDGNILVRPRDVNDRPSSSKYQLIPIDHGMILPEHLNIIEEDIVWMSWPQAREPWSKSSIQFVEALNSEFEDGLAEVLGIGTSELRLKRCCTVLLQLGVIMGLTLFDIGQIMYRQELNEPSAFEDILAQSLQKTQEAERMTMRCQSLPPWQIRKKSGGKRKDSSRKRSKLEAVCFFPEEFEDETVVWAPHTEDVFLDFVKRGIVSYVEQCEALNPESPSYAARRADRGGSV